MDQQGMDRQGMDRQGHRRSGPGPEPMPARLRLARAACEVDGLRARRAARLARIRAAAAAPDEAERPEPAREVDASPEPARDVSASPAPARDVDALERFLADLVGAIGMEPAPPPPAPSRLAPVLPLARSAGPGGDAGDPAAARDLSRLPGARDLSRLPGARDLSRLPGAGPGLVGALVRGGVPDLATLAGLGRDALGERLGPLGRLIDLDGWLAFARAAAGSARCRTPDAPMPHDLAG